MTTLIAATFPLAARPTEKAAVLVDHVVAVAPTGRDNENATIHLAGGHTVAVAVTVDDVLAAIRGARQARYDENLRALDVAVQLHPVTPGGAR